MGCLVTSSPYANRQPLSKLSTEVLVFLVISSAYIL